MESMVSDGVQSTLWTLHIFLSTHVGWGQSTEVAPCHIRNWHLYPKHSTPLAGEGLPLKLCVLKCGVAYKQQKLISHLSEDWKSEVRVPA